jgi:hypothetical protein
MVDIPEGDKISDALSFLQNHSEIVSPMVRAAAGYASGQGSAMAFSSFIYAPPSDGYLPDPHDDPASLLTLFLTLPPRGVQIGDAAMMEQLRVIHQLSGELCSKMSELELGIYLMLMTLMSQSPRNVINALARTQNNGSGQRKIIWAVADALFPDLPDQVSEFRLFFRSLLTSLEQLQGRRNTVAHSIINITSHLAGPRILITGTNQPSKLPKLEPKEVETEIEACLSEADRLLQAMKHYLHYVSTDVLSLPDPVSPQPKSGWTNPLVDNPVEKAQQKKRQPKS